MEQCCGTCKYHVPGEVPGRMTDKTAGQSVVCGAVKR